MKECTWSLGNGTVYFRLAWFPVIPGSDTHNTLLWDREGGKHSWVLSNIIINPSQVYCMPTIFPMQQCFLLVYLSHSPPAPSPSPPPPPPPSIFLTQFVLVTVPHPSPGYTPTPWSVTGHSRCEERNSPGPGLLTESFMALYLYTTCDYLITTGSDSFVGKLWCAEGNQVLMWMWWRGRCFPFKSLNNCGVSGFNIYIGR